ncbi:MAG TPA: hypothetical protein VGQ20_11500 [Acidimicrobiales bacterium]|nr:hypothetical protein [Acidimicrobiales bacterium]
MSGDAAELSSASSMLEDIVTRLLDVAHRYEGTDREDIAHQLHEVERSLRRASRQLETTRRSLT